MRKILFRGKRIDNGKWAYGDLQSQAIPLTSILTYEQDCGYGDLVPVDPTTVGQFTGLTDKYGKKIFEGDFFAHPKSTKNKYVVEFEDGTFEPFSDDVCGFDPSKIKIIGNIYDNPELLA